MRKGVIPRGRKNPLPFLFSALTKSTICAQAIRRNGRSSKRKGNHGCPFLFVLAPDGAASAARGIGKACTVKFAEYGARYNKVFVRSDAGKTTERLKMQSLGCFAYDSEVSAVLII
jgi:hypothetical protein